MDRQRPEYHQIIRMHLSTAYLLSEEKIDTVLPRLLVSLQTLLQNLVQVAESSSLEEVGRAGHAIKGALLNLGLHDLAATALVLEQTCRAGDSGRDCTPIIAELKEEIGKII